MDLKLFSRGEGTVKKIDGVLIRSNLLLMNDKNTDIFSEDRF